MTPMMPKMSVSPEATRNSSNPYWSALRHWTRKVAMSIAGGGRGHRSSHAAAGAGIGERLRRDADHLVLLADHLAQVHVLHRIVGGADGEGAARAVDPRGGDGLRELGLLRHIAVGRVQSDREHLRRVVALHRVDVGRYLVRLLVRRAECLVLRVVEAVAVVEGREKAVGVGALRLERAVGDEARAVERDR